MERDLGKPAATIPDDPDDNSAALFTELVALEPSLPCLMQTPGI